MPRRVNVHDFAGNVRNARNSLASARRCVPRRGAPLTLGKAVAKGSHRVFHGLSTKLVDSEVRVRVWTYVVFSFGVQAPWPRPRVRPSPPAWPAPCGTPDRPAHLRRAEALDEAGDGPPERLLRSDGRACGRGSRPRTARRRARSRSAAGRPRNRRVQLTELLVDLGPRARRVRPVEADPARLLGEPVGARERRHLPGHALERALPLAASAAFSSRFSAAHCFSTASASFTWASPKTWGWRETSLSEMASATSAKPNCPASSVSCAWNTIWRSRSPSSSRCSRGSPASIASSTS